MTDDLITVAARLKRDQATGHVELTGDLIRREAEAHGITPEELQQAIADAVLDQGDGGGPLPEREP